MTQEAPELILSGGDIITINEAQPTAEAVAVSDGKIAAVGARDDIMALKGDATRVVDLQGRTLLPGFIDAHSHFNMALQVSGWANVSLPPVGPVEDLSSLIEALQAHATRMKIAKGEWIIAYGYDADGLTEGRHVTRADLDPHFPDNPVMLLHVSNHGCVLNSGGFAKYSINAATPTPAGGVIARMSGSDEPAGLLMETAFLPVFSGMPQPTEDEKLASFERAQLEYARNGYTTIQEGATHFAEYEMMRKAADRGLLFLDLVSLPLMTDLARFFAPDGPQFGAYEHRLKLGGIKVITDGSPQGRTAYFTKPFLTGGPSGQEEWCGEPAMPQEQVSKIVKMVVDRGIQTFTHANGDAAADMIITALRSAGVNKVQDRRDVVIHSNFMRADQIESYVELGMSPSFFTNHAFFWGDVHVKNLGEDRAFFLSPMRTAIDRGLRCSNHTDYTITPLDPAMTIWSAVTRTSRSGRIIGPDQRATPLEALCALTIDAAYQHHEDQAKGSIEVGKLADFVILDRNPLTAAPVELRDMKVLETIKEGVTVFAA